jgi:tetratricopeptide (TPR) repeat protein
MSAYEVKRIDELPGHRLENLNLTWRPVRRTFGITAFGMNAYTGDTGQHVVEPHTEEMLGHEEVYVVLSGLARFTLGEEEVVADAGTLVYLRDPGTHREAVALEDGTTVLAIGGRPGQHEPSAWEWFFEARSLRDRGDLEGALAIIHQGKKVHPDHPSLLYNIARYNLLLGRPPQDALPHLRRALELNPDLVPFAREDPDFTSVRDDPEFLAITGQADAPGPGP